MQHPLMIYLVNAGCRPSRAKDTVRSVSEGERLLQRSSVLAQGQSCRRHPAARSWGAPQELLSESDLLTHRIRHKETIQVVASDFFVCSVLWTIYGFWLVYAAGLQYMIVGAVFFALGNLVFIWARKEHAPQESPFNKIELIVAVIIVALGILALWMLFTGHLTQVYNP
jgi:hypothetical protein